MDRRACNDCFGIACHERSSKDAEELLRWDEVLVPRSERKGIKPSLPYWLSPTQVRLIPLNESFLKNCEEFADMISKKNVRVDIDDRNESLGKRVRDAEKQWIHHILVIDTNNIYKYQSTNARRS